MYVDPHKFVLPAGTEVEACQKNDTLRSLCAKVDDGAMTFSETTAHTDIEKAIELGLVSKVRDDKLREVIEGLITALAQPLK